MEPLRDDAGLLAPPEFVPPPRRKFQNRWWLHLTLFALTAASTIYTGVGHYVGFIADFQPLQRLPMPIDQLLVRGLWYSGTVIAILGCHELGHYAACRYYDVDASLPYFLPMPLLMTGTLGAFIRIREPLPSKRVLFDVGIAGPIAGFIVAVPALFIGLSMSRLVPMPPPQFVAGTLGEPLLFRLAERMIFGSPPDTLTLNLHPMAFAAWFGLLATALNLFPIGQLDGGHVSYAVLGRRSTSVTVAMICVTIGLSFVSVSWIMWSVLMVAMLVAFGPRHPVTPDDHVPLNCARLALAFRALAMFVVCFTPAPMQPADLIR